MEKTRKAKNIKIVDRYTLIGVVFLVVGILFTEYSLLFLKNVQLTAVGFSIIILGAATSFIPENPVPSDIVRSMINEVYLNIESILSQFEASEKCVYLPPKNQQFFAYVSLAPKLPPIASLKKLDSRSNLVTSIDDHPGLLITVPISTIVFNSGTEESNLEALLKQILVDQYETVDSIKALQTNSQIVVQMSGIKISLELPRFNKVFGSLQSSLVGSILAYKIDQPILFKNEIIAQNEVTAYYEVKK